MTYETRGTQKAVDFLCKHYQVRRMRIIVDGRKVSFPSVTIYHQNKAYFSKRGLTKRTVLHEFYHHLAYAYGLDLMLTAEERAANRYSLNFCKKAVV